MATDYKAIADRAVAIIGTPDPLLYATAFATMKAETTTQPKAHARHTPLTLARELGFAVGASVVAKFKALGGDMMALLLADDAGVDLLDPEAKAMMAAWHDNLDPTKLTDAEYTALIGLTADDTVPVWEGLAPGHVYDALIKRVAGEV